MSEIKKLQCWLVDTDIYCKGDTGIFIGDSVGISERPVTIESVFQRGDIAYVTVRDGDELDELPASMVKSKTEVTSSLHINV